MPALSIAFPDVCKIPTPVGPVPVPLIDITLSVLAIPNVANKFITAMPVHNLMTTTPTSTGNEPGVLGGIVSSRFDGALRHLLGSFKVFYSCMPATKMLSPTLQNGMLSNMVGLTLTPSQIKVMILS